jgi:hypothetical protein
VRAIDSFRQASCFLNWCALIARSKGVLVTSFYRSTCYVRIDSLIGKTCSLLQTIYAGVSPIDCLTVTWLA